jgi:hypothetical protein
MYYNVVCEMTFDDNEITTNKNKKEYLHNDAQRIEEKIFRSGGIE